MNNMNLVLVKITLITSAIFLFYCFNLKYMQANLIDKSKNEKGLVRTYTVELLSNLHVY